MKNSKWKHGYHAHFLGVAKSSDPPVNQASVSWVGRRAEYATTVKEDLASGPVAESWNFPSLAILCHLEHEVSQQLTIYWSES